MLRPITTAPTFACASWTTGVLALTSPPSSPCCRRHASSGKTHWCSSRLPTPSGFSLLWSGPATNPSSDTVSWNLHVPSNPPRFRGSRDGHSSWVISTTLHRLDQRPQPIRHEPVDDGRHGAGCCQSSPKERDDVQGKRHPAEE